MYGTTQTIVLAVMWTVVLAGLPWVLVRVDRWSRRG